MSSAIARMRCWRSSAWTRISPISSLMGPRSLGARPAALGAAVVRFDTKALAGGHARHPRDLAVGDHHGQGERRSRGTLRSVNRSCSDLLPPRPSGRIRSPGRHGRTSSVRAARPRRASRRRSATRPSSQSSSPAPSATRPGTGSSAPQRDRGGAGALDPHAPVLGRWRADRRAGRAAAVPRGPEREDRVGVRGDATAPGRRRRRRRAAGARAARAPAASAASRLGVAAASSARRRASSTAASSRSSRERAQDVLLRRRVQLAQRRQEVARMRPRADVALLASSRHGSPRSTQYAAVCSRVMPSSGRHDPARALRHPEQRAPARRGGEPVEDGLDLVGRGVAGGDQRAARLREPLRLGVAHLARPGLHVARAARPARCTSAARRAARTARRSTPRRRRPRPAQPVVDVQRRHRPGATHREVEQAGRVAPAGEGARRPAPRSITARPPGTARWPRRSP